MRSHNESLKMVLGDMGIEIIKTLRHGPMDMNSIAFLSGVPPECVKGRIPVLKNLNIIEEQELEYMLREEGLKFLQFLDDGLEYRERHQLKS